MDDVISRRVAIDAVETIGHIATMPDGDKCIRRSAVKYTLSMLPSAQTEIRCKDCGHFHYDMPYVIQGVPVLGHEVCDFWGDGCKTSENGYCSFAERKTDGADVNT